MNTRITYRYRDGDNYQCSKSVVVSGEVNSEAKERILASLDEGQFFVPLQVGLPDCSQIGRGYKPTEADHNWSTLEADGFEKTEEAANIEITATELLERFMEAEGAWDLEIGYLPSEEELGGMYLLDEVDDAMEGPETREPEDEISVYAVVENQANGVMRRKRVENRTAAENLITEKQAGSDQPYMVWGEAYTRRGWDAALEAWASRGVDPTAPELSL